MEKISENKLKTIIKDLLGEFLNPIKKSLEVEMKELKESVQFMSNSFDDHKTKIEKVMKELKQIKRKNMDLKTKLNELEKKINNQEQKEKQNNMIIVGVPKQNEKDPKKTVKKIIRAMKIEVADEDVKEVFRIGKKEDAPILIKLSKQEMKTEILKTIKKIKGIKTNKCGLEGRNNNLFFNEDLTNYNQNLFKTAREFKKTHKLKSVYTMYGKIYLRKNDTDAPVRISSKDDLCL